MYVPGWRRGLSSFKQSYPLVAIAGRPNVGKSTLFNALLGNRKAITDPTPGVTRDAIETECVIGSARVRLVDTGGLNAEPGELDNLVNDRSLEQIDKADLVLLMLDITDVTAEDETFIKLLRKYSDKIILVVNKMDSPDREDLLWDYYSHGFKEVIGISSVHRRNFDLLAAKVCEFIEAHVSDSPRGAASLHDITISLLGKPNTGKSTLLNQLTKKELSIVSNMPGTTRDVIESLFEYKDRVFRVYDTAGVRRKKKVAENIEYYSVTRAISTIQHSDVVLLMIDSAEGLSDQDKKIASLAVKHGRGIIIVMNKWDLLDDIPNRLNAVRDKVRFQFPVLEFAPVIPVSALTGEGVHELLDKVIKLKKQLETEVTTGKLNSYIKYIVDQNPPPLVKYRPLRIKYGTQTATNPQKFLFFVNRKKNFPESYLRYMLNNLRREFHMTNIPVEIELRANKNKYTAKQESR